MIGWMKQWFDFQDKGSPNYTIFVTTKRGILKNSIVVYYDTQ